MAAENPDFKGNPTDFALTVPVEQIVNSNGETEILANVVGTSPEVVEQVVEYEIKERGARRITKEESSSFGFSGSWNAPWNPEGPKKNWGYNPDTVRDN